MAPAYVSPMSPTLSYSYSSGSPHLPTISAPTPTRMPLRRSMKPSMLPDIAETSPIQPPVERPVRNVRPQSLQSLLSVGTIEVDGFGFLEEDEDEGGEDTWDMESLSPSIYESSIYDGHEGHGNEDGRVTPSTLSRRAERVLENAKKKLDLCGQNLTRARHSLIVSPPGSSMSGYSDPDSDRTSTPRTMTPTNNRTATPTRNHTGTPTNAFRTITPTNAPVPLSVVQLRASNNAAHVRTVSESAVPTVYNLQRVNSIGRGSEDGKEEPERRRSQSAQQMRNLRDQMKDLRGKISSLQHQSRSDSLKRVNSRASPVPYGSNRSTPTPTGFRDWEIDEYMNANGAYTDSVVSSRSTTPKPGAAVRESRHEDREDAFSYDSLFIGNGIYAPRTLLKQAELGRRSDSRGSFRSTHSETILGTTEIENNRDSPTLGHHDRGLSPVVLRRLDSFASVSSYTTADDGGYIPSPTGSINSSSSGSLRHRSRAPSSASIARLSPKVGSSPDADRVRDDGYHSAPHTPRGSNEPPKDTSTTASSSSFRTTIAASSSSSTPPPAGGAGGSFLLPPTPGKLSRRGSRIMSGSAGVEISGHIMTTGAGDADITLQLALEDRLLIERLIEELGKTCCAMEVASEKGDVAALRRRLEMALQVLEG
ncbi:hypothetical protein L211DRAFT_384286 [Terfezia boudieri ATCC MYA-4762]|uniref:Uncharacterized protein n=1 Tax=Terfezia boudieri ATCC MYA-4762 TaxID=1051890 RepID=A0A3N4M6X9_9PEZI|nr:hypothetical protein L211DRAFT_384286 [Terfezia boudieri ATCC MYA-4762]